MCRMFTSISGLYSFEVSSTPPLVMITKNVSRQCGMSPGGQNYSFLIVKHCPIFFKVIKDYCPRLLCVCYLPSPGLRTLQTRYCSSAAMDYKGFLVSSHIMGNT